MENNPQTPPMPTSLGRLRIKKGWLKMELKKKNTDKISKEKLQWMEEVGITEFDKPMKYCHCISGMLYSEEYIKSTSLEVLKEKLNKQNVKNNLEFKN